MQIDLKKEIQAISEETIATRRDIHAHPELGFQEFRTAQIVEDTLKELGLRVRRCAGTGVIGVLEGGKPGKTVMLRADMDALPVNEENDLPFRSQTPGVMHACGHDCHVAIQLAVAKILAPHKDEIEGTVVFLFQPNEEVLGAPMMIEDGALTDPRPDAIFGMHVWASQPFGTVAITSGPIFASSYYFKVTIHGKSTHGCSPSSGVSPIEAGRHVLNAICSMQTMEFGTIEEPTLITVGSIHAGDYMNIIPDTLTMEGSIRCMHENEKAVHARFTELVKAVAAAYRCACDVEINFGNSLLSNDPELTEMVKGILAESDSVNAVTDQGIREMGGDDFAEFLREGNIPGCYCLVGFGNHENGTDWPHHSKEFLVDEAVLDINVELQVRLVLRYLGMM
ncbi:MAG: amidohydrolase [Clostridia bacterium]|nr:amidohydrolase [Clostridia bacterium]